jgi:hypothetical protein
MEKLSLGWIAVGAMTAALTPAFGQDGAPNTLTAAEKKAGWILLFDGKSMHGWEDPRERNPPGDAWTIEDGALKAQPHPKITEDLFLNRTFKDFELAWEWKISPAGNSGVKYRIQDHLFVPRPKPGEKFEASVEEGFAHRTGERPERGQDYVIGFEYQMTDAANSDARSGGAHSAGALYDVVAPSTAAARPTGEWNHSRLLVRGNHVEHWLNGVKVVDTTLDSPEERAAAEKRWSVAPHVAALLIKQPKKDCPISLQNHGNACWFRSIKARPLN